MGGDDLGVFSFLAVGSSACLSTATGASSSNFCLSDWTWEVGFTVSTGVSSFGLYYLVEWLIGYITHHFSSLPPLLHHHLQIIFSVMVTLQEYFILFKIWLFHFRFFFLRFGFLKIFFRFICFFFIIFFLNFRFGFLFFLFSLRIVRSYRN